jgi:PAT family beta-lactamase induction signal transducer AmpG
MSPKLFANNRLFIILMLGFASGLPVTLIGSTLQAWFTEANLSVVSIGALSLVGIPYSLKFIWAPLMDHYGFSGIGKRKGWILLMQLALAAALFVIANMHPSGQAKGMALVALAIAFFSATQDAAITAYQTDVLLPEERGLGVAYYIFSYRLAALVSGGLALVMADYLGWMFTYDIMAVLIAGCAAMTYFAPRATELVLPSRHIFDTVTAALSDLFSREKILILLLFIMLYKFGDALALQLMTTFLLKGLGFTLVEVGLAYKIVSFVATVLGAFVGGALMMRWSIYRALLWFGLAQACSNFMFVILAMTGKSFTLMAASIFIENFCGGLSTAALFAFLMSLCNHRYTASQFALLSAIASLGRVIMGPVAGLLVAHYGWVDFYIIAFILSFPGLIFLVLLKKRVIGHEYAAAK